jgi:AcrR family transcriptional regulator
MTTTPERILETAEGLFARHGYKAVSLRSVTRESGANIAAIHYHFGTKDALLEAIFARRCAAMNGERLRLLSLAEANGPARLEEVLDAYLRPSLVWPDDDTGARRFMRLRAVVAHEQEAMARALVARHFNTVSRRFIDAVAALCPHLPLRDVHWRFHFLLGAHYYTLASPGRIEALSDGSCDTSDAETALAQMIAFVAAGFRAPPCGVAAAPTGLEAAE